MDTTIIAEEWRPVVGYEGVYEVSSLGRVKRVRACTASPMQRILRSFLDHKGYPSLQLNMNGQSKPHKVHRLVATAFIPAVEGKTIINHKNGLKTDNTVANLEWSTHSENIRHSLYVLGNITQIPRGANHNSKTKPSCVPRGSRRSGAKITESDVLEIRSLVSSGVQYARISAQFGVSESLISKVIRGHKWKHVPAWVRQAQEASQS